MMAVCKKRTGTCKCFGNSTGFGFIIAEDGSNVFMHITNCIDGKMPVEGDVLTYELGPSTKKPGKTAALNVTGGSAKQTAEERANGGGKMTPMMLKIMKLEKELTDLKGEFTKLKADKIRKRAIPYCDIDVSAEERIKAIEERLAQRESKRSENDMAKTAKVQNSETETGKTGDSEIERMPIMHNKATEIELECQLQAIALTGMWIPLASTSGWVTGSVVRVNTKLNGDSVDEQEIVQGTLGEVLKTDDEGDLLISFAIAGGKLSQWVNVDKHMFLDGLDCPDG
jgi:CspA family cold shock protein